MTNASPKFNIVGQYMRDISFENLVSREITPGEAEPMINVNADVEYKPFAGLAQLPQNTYEVVLSLSIDMSIETKKLFIAEIKFGAIVQFEESCSEEQIEPIVYIEVPYYLYFESRNIISSLAFQAGFGPIFLRPIDFAGLYFSKSKYAEKFAQETVQ